MPPGVRRGFRYRLVPLPPPLRLACLAPRAQHLAGALERPHPSLRGVPCRPAFSNWPQHRPTSLQNPRESAARPLADVEPRWSLAAGPVRRIARCIDAHPLARTAAIAWQERRCWLAGAPLTSGPSRPIALRRQPGTRSTRRQDRSRAREASSRNGPPVRTRLPPASRPRRGITHPPPSTNGLTVSEDWPSVGEEDAPGARGGGVEEGAERVFGEVCASGSPEY